MEDVGKALIMAGQVLMFAFAATIAILLYNSLTARVDELMLAENYSNRGDAIVDLDKTDNTRNATKEEIIMAILDLKTKYEKTNDSSYIVSIVGGNIYTFDSNQYSITVNGVPKDNEGLRAVLNGIADTNYRLTYDETGKVLEYRVKP